MSENQDTYRILLPQFEGPFDLLLFFIERDEIDIHDIPISTITEEFLEYMKQMESMNIELAAEFILVASTLMRIKAKMLLPRPQLNEEGEEIDPREELVRRLLEYKRYKEVLGQLADLEEAQSQRTKRGFSANEEKEFLKSDLPEEELVGLDLFTIMRTFKRLMEKHQEEMQAPTHVIKKYKYSLDQVKNRMLERVLLVDRVDFTEFVMEEKDRIFVVFSFLAVLELVQSQKLDIIVGEGFNNFWIEKKAKEAA